MSRAMTDTGAVDMLDRMEGDPATARREADEILLDYLDATGEDLRLAEGAGDVAEAYRRARERVGFWYA